MTQNIQPTKDCLGFKPKERLRILRGREFTKRASFETKNLVPKEGLGGYFLEFLYNFAPSSNFLFKRSNIAGSICVDSERFSKM